MSKLWSKGYELNARIEEFTVGEDYILDVRLIPADILGSLAHATMLESVQLLTPGQLSDLQEGLLKIFEEHQQGTFQIHPSDEDGHTAIENRLIELSGEAGKRIHLGRSRNDQVLTTMRIWMRHTILEFVEAGTTIVSDLLAFAQSHRNAPMAGRTHMQPAMPSTVGLWAGGFAEQLLDDVQAIADLFPYMDQCPLGSGAGYGIPLPLDRELTASLLGFSRIQNNVTYSGLSRGKFESRLVDAVEQIALTLSKFAADVILFSLPEFGWFHIPEELCTGSSIMPQKRNPDALELMRSKTAIVSSCSELIKSIIRSLPSGYNRDYQDTKGPTMRAIDTVRAMLEITGLTVRKLSIDTEQLLKAFDKSIFATDAALNLVAQGMSFRNAYKEVGMHPEAFSGGDPEKAIADRSSSGMAGNPCFHIAQSQLEAILVQNTSRRKAIEKAFHTLTGREISPV